MSGYSRVGPRLPRVLSFRRWGWEANEEVTGIDLADVDADSDDEAFSRDWENSPSKKGKVFG
jgi:hypothetical protein